ncbi:glycosyltransferase [Parablastomonas sp. CN1-191]|uniref:glycosyltransferase n=1 Tax=Parablastomonas sp. CN1-191 TaxID=3400908 RepID=UPI003BF89BA5
MHGTTHLAAHSVRPIRVLLLLTSLHGGGAERVAVHLLNRLDPERFDVRMGLLRAAGPYIDLVEDKSRLIVAPDGDKHFNFDGTNKAQYTTGNIVGAAARAPLAFRRMIRESEADVVMSFLKGTNLLVWLALKGLGKKRPKWIAREGNNVLAVVGEEAPSAFIRKASLGLTSRAYRAADAVLANSTDMASGLVEDLGLEAAKMRMINNPIDIERIAAMRDEGVPAAPKRPFIICAGRLEYQKAHEVLLRAYAKSGVWRTHALVILGKGSKLNELHRLAAQLGIGEYVRFIGFVANPYAWMAKADLMVLPSRWEGFPTAAAEALASGTPLLMTDCKFGARDVMEPGVSGEMVPVDDVDALANAISSLIADPARRKSLRDGGLERVRNFAIDAMVEKYADLFAEFEPVQA